MSPGMNMITANDLMQDFVRAGIKSGDHIIMHSSFKKVGPVQHGPAAVINALLKTIGSTGNLLVPTYTYSLPIWNAEPFDVRYSASRVGAITEEVRKRTAAIRSFHPTHSVCAIGPDAPAVTLNHLHATPLGVGSPLDRMRRMNAKVLMLGTFQDTNSSLHLCEELHNLPYCDVGFSEELDHEIGWFFNEKREIEYVQLPRFPGCSRGFRAIEEHLRREGVLQDVYIGQAASQLLNLPRLVEATAAPLASDPGMLLCNVPNCAICPRRRNHLLKCA